MIEEQIRVMMQVLDYVEYVKKQKENNNGFERFYRAVFENSYFDIKDEDTFFKQVHYIRDKFNTIMEVDRTKIYEFVAYIDKLSKVEVIHNNSALPVDIDQLAAEWNKFICSK